jgi:choline-sulfatase
MSDNRPNVLFLQSDEHSFRCFGRLADGEPVRTPTLDDLAASGAVFEQSYCPMPLCTPSRIATLTGRRVRTAGAWNNGAVLTPENTTVAETFSGAGYRTCHVGKLHVEGTRQFAGFDHRPYGNFSGAGGHQPDPPTPDESKGYTDMRSRTDDAGITGIPESALQERTVVDETVAFLREHRASNPDQPWFLNASFSRPHFPLTAPRRHFERYWDPDADEPTDRLTEPAVPPGGDGDAEHHPAVRAACEHFEMDAITPTEQRRARAAYLAAVDFLDEVLGDLLATLDREGLLENTIVVYATDHGELAGEHGLWWKSTWHEASARAPMIVQLPGHRSGDIEPATIETPVSLIDLFPTLCGLTGVDYEADIDGVDLAAAVETGAEPDRGPVCCDYLDPLLGEGTEYRMVRDGRYKYVRYRDAPELLFDLEADPDEQTNLAPAPGEHAAALERLRGLVDETLDFEAAEHERQRDRERWGAYQLGASDGTGIAYLLPDGRLVDADRPLYHPHVLAEEPSIVFDDYPE